jgi:DNA-binding XRE family transcriptional regulator
MAVQRKKKVKKHVNKSEFFRWTTARKATARLMSTGTKTQKEIAQELNLTGKTICEWKQYPEFLQEVDRLTFLQENATRAGIVRKALKAIEKKEKYISEDRSTLLDYLEFLVKIIPPEVKAEDDPLKELADAIMQSAKMIGK